VAAVFSWRWSFWVLVPIALVLAFSVARLPEPRRGAQIDSAVRGGAKDTAAAGTALCAGSTQQSRSHLVSSLLYFFLAALRTFSSVFVQDQYSVGQAIGTMVLPLVGLGAVVGVLAGGRLSDGLMRAGHIRGRIVSASSATALRVVLFLPAFASSVLLIALPLFFLASAALGLLNPPLEAANGCRTRVRAFGMPISDLTRRSTT